MKKRPRPYPAVRSWRSIMQTLRAVLCVVCFVGLGSLSRAADEDQFSEGTIFNGKRVFLDAKGNKIGEQKWSLKVTERKGNTFKGEITLMGKDEPADYPVEGTAVAKGDGVVKFKSEKGNFNQTFVGKIKKGEIGLEFIGTGA